MKRACVLGGGGVIGIPLCSELQRNGFSVTGVTLTSKCPPQLDCEWIVGVPAEQVLIREGPWDLVVDLRAYQTADVVELSRQCSNISKLWMHISSIYVYRSFRESWLHPDPRHFVPVPIREDEPCCPSGPYGLGKFDCERLWLQRQENDGAPVVIVRLPFVVGSGDRLRRANHYVSRIRSGNVLIPLGGDCRVDILFARDAARLLCAIATCPDARGQIFNVASGEAFCLREHVEAIGQALRKQARIVSAPPPKTPDQSPPFCFPVDVVLDISRLRQFIALPPSTPLAEGWRLAIQEER